MTDQFNCRLERSEVATNSASGQLSAEMWQAIGESRDRRQTRPDLRNNPFFGFDGPTPEGKKLMESLGIKDEPRKEHCDGLHQIDILNRELKAVKRVHDHYDNKGLASEKTELTRLLGHTFSKDEQAYLRDQMRQFETRAWANSIGKDEVAQTYGEIARILKAQGQVPLTPELRKQVAREVLRHCAIPTIISQGAHNTCNVTAIESRTYSLYPAKAAKLVADIATSGEHRTKNGIRVALDERSLVPDREALHSIPERGERDFATQLFNLAAVNIWYSAVKPGRRYEQETKVVDGEPVYEEQVVDYKGGKRTPVLDPSTKKPLDGPYLSADQIAFISDAVVGRHEPFAVLSMGAKSLSLPDEKHPSVHAADIVDEPHLPGILDALKRNRLLPAIAAVDTSVNPLNADSGLALYGNGGGHVINIADYQTGKNPRASIDNEWSAKEDHLNGSVDAHELFLCMAGREVARLDALVSSDDSEKKGQTDAADALRRVRYDGQNGWSLDDYAKDAGNTISRLAHAERNLSGAERTKWFNELTTVVNTLPVADKVPLLKRIQANSICSESEFGTILANAARSISLKKSEALESGDKSERAGCVRATTDLAEYLITLPAETRKSYFAVMRQL